MENICKITGLEKTVHIEYFLGDESLGKTMCSECSWSESRINSAKEIGIEYYDRFILDNGRLDTKDVKMMYDGVLSQQNDFKKADPSEYGMDSEGNVLKNPNYK